MRGVAIGFCCLALLLGNVGCGEAPPRVRTVSVSGSVETRTAPDQVVWRITLTDTDKDLRAAKARNDQKVKSVVALGKKLRLGEGDLETGRVNIRREYERDERGRRGDFKHFVINRNVTIRERDLKRFDELLDTLVSSAEMEGSFSLESSRIHEVRAETRLKALEVARDKAAAMAKVVGAKLGPVVTINEHPPGDRESSRYSNVTRFYSTPAVDLATEKFVPGAINVRVTVYATFELE